LDNFIDTPDKLGQSCFDLSLSACLRSLIQGARWLLLCDFDDAANDVEIVFLRFLVNHAVKIPISRRECVPSPRFRDRFLSDEMRINPPKVDSGAPQLLARQRSAFG
jgi:hypothetical protein